MIPTKYKEKKIRNKIVNFLEVKNVVVVWSKRNNNVKGAFAFKTL